MLILVACHSMGVGHRFFIRMDARVHDEGQAGSGRILTEPGRRGSRMERDLSCWEARHAKQVITDGYTDRKEGAVYCWLISVRFYSELMCAAFAMAVIGRRCVTNTTHALLKPAASAAACVAHARAQNPTPRGICAQLWPRGVRRDALCRGRLRQRRHPVVRRDALFCRWHVGRGQPAECTSSLVRGRSPSMSAAHRLP